MFLRYHSFYGLNIDYCPTTYGYTMTHCIGDHQEPGRVGNEKVTHTNTPTVTTRLSNPLGPEIHTKK